MTTVAAKRGRRDQLIGPFAALAKITSKHWGVTISASGVDCSTNGDHIKFPWNTDDIETVPFQVLNGYLDHEVGHVAEERAHREAGQTTPFEFLRAEKRAAVRLLFNGFEDVRMERKRTIGYPGVAENLRAAAKYQSDKIAAVGRSDHPGVFWDNLMAMIYFVAFGFPVAGFPRSHILAFSLLREEMKDLERAVWARDTYALALRAIAKLQDLAKPPSSNDDDEEEEEEGESLESSEEADEDDEDEKQSKRRKQEDEGEDKDEDKESESESDKDDDGESSEGEEGDESEEDSEDGSDDSESAGEEDEESDGDSEESDGDEGDTGEDGADDSESDGEGEDGDPSDGDSSDGSEDEESDGDASDDGSSFSNGDAQPTPEKEHGESREDVIRVAIEEGGDNELNDLAEAIEEEPTTDNPMSDLKKEIEERAVELAYERYVPNSQLAALDTWITEPSYHPDRFNKIHSEVRSQISALKAKFIQVLAARTQARNEFDREEGRLDTSSLHQLRTGSKRVFYAPSPGIMLNTSASLLIDLSGSMGKADIHGPDCRSYYARLAAIALAETFDAINVPFEAIGFHNVMCNLGRVTRERGTQVRLPFEFRIFKEFHEPYRKTRFRFVGITGRSDNADGEAVLEVAKRLFVRPEARKMLFVLSDGEPLCGGLEQSKAEWHLKDAIKRTTKSGIEVFGIGLNHAAISKFYNKSTGASSICVDSKETMAREIFKSVRERFFSNQRGSR